MSEIIDNKTRRLNELKEIVLALHRGVPVEEVRDRFQDLIRGVEYGEVAAMEQALMEEGMPVEEIMKLCDAHAAVFQEELEGRQKPEMTPGHPVHTMRLENAEILKAVNNLKKALAGDLSAAKDSLEKLMEIDRHYTRKENILFPYLEKKGIYGPPKVMWGIHDEIRAGLKSIASSLDGDARPDPEKAEEVLDSIISMVQKEENILIPMLLENLDEDEWADVLAQEAEVGYAFVEPSHEWGDAVKVSGSSEAQADDGSAMSRPDEAAGRDGIIPLSTGSLSPREIDLMLRHLPFDITFVDAEDCVRYYSEGDRIFPRSPAIIGRKVQNCHPPSSVHIVNRIVEEFRKGTRDSAEFWIQMKGRFLHIRYFAVRDGGGQYRGVIEVSQDVTDIRNLEGEKRLLDRE